ncbi:MAG: hypothetical protein DRI40_06840 [Chloroflexi bacterium]|nr:MAG: hypothetical protein DRI40_06840 [Chloroflexota bacterium]
MSRDEVKRIGLENYRATVPDDLGSESVTVTDPEGPKRLDVAHGDATLVCGRADSPEAPCALGAHCRDRVEPGLKLTSVRSWAHAVEGRWQK